jgi:hypothetical protein
MNLYRKFVYTLFIVPLLLTGNALAADDKKPSGTIVIDETQVMLIVGGDIGGGTLKMGDKSYSFTTGGLKIGGLGVQTIHLVGEVYYLKDVADFPGAYFAVQAGATAGDAGAGVIWLKNPNGVKLKVKASKAQGLALSVGVEGLQITMK